MKVSAQLQISADGHWLEHNHEKKLLVGESITQGWMELGANFNQTAYLDSLAARGNNVLLNGTNKKRTAKNARQSSWVSPKIPFSNQLKKEFKQLFELKPYLKCKLKW